MEIKEIVERQMCQDPRVFNAIQNAKKTDNSFKEKGFLGMPIRYSQAECREFWFQAMSLGMIEGLRMATIEGQKIDLLNNCKTPKQKEFLEKFFKLAEAYNCAIVFHPNEGMIITDLNK